MSLVREKRETGMAWYGMVWVVLGVGAGAGVGLGC